MKDLAVIGDTVTKALKGEQTAKTGEAWRRSRESGVQQEARVKDSAEVGDTVTKALRASRQRRSAKALMSIERVQQEARVKDSAEVGDAVTKALRGEQTTKAGEAWRRYRDQAVSSKRLE